MRVAAYARVSTDRQQLAQTIQQQVELLRAYVRGQPEWVLDEAHVFRDDGCSGARLQRPGLDALRDQVARAAFDAVVITAPDRLARHFVHQMVVLDEWERAGIQVVFIDRPPSRDPHEQLVTQIRGAVAEYERYADIGITLVMPTGGLCRPGAARGRAACLPGRGTRSGSRHKHRPSRKDRRRSGGRKRPGATCGGAGRARARSLSRRSACRSTWVVRTVSWPSQRAMTLVSTPACSIPIPERSVGQAAAIMPTFQSTSAGRAGSLQPSEPPPVGITAPSA
jgi:hypothetical protein